MIAINLLSTQEKIRLKNDKAFNSIKEIILLVLLFSAVAGIILVFANHFLGEKLEKISQENANQIGLSQAVDNQISATNKKISELAGVQKDFKPWSGFIFAISQLAGQGITYKSLSINYQGSYLTITGQAKTRDDLLKFKESLGQSPLFTGIDLPLSDLMPKDNNSFTIKATLNLNKIQ
jgi:Tfp pilus assembly protein PilN